MYTLEGSIKSDIVLSDHVYKNYKRYNKLNEYMHND